MDREAVTGDTGRVAAIVVGRAEELGRALELVRGAGNGRFRAIVVHGDAGTGKTTLMRAACAEAGDEALVLVGSCLPLTSVSVPLMGLRSALRALPADERPPGLGGPSTPSGNSSSDVAVPVPVAFDDWLAGRARQAPVVLALDDIHWADGETLDVLTYVLAGPEERRLVLLLTVRTSEVGERHPLWRWLADARRLPGVEEVTLGPLTRDEIGDEVSLVLGRPPIRLSSTRCSSGAMATPTSLAFSSPASTRRRRRCRPGCPSSSTLPPWGAGARCRMTRSDSSAPSRSPAARRWGGRSGGSRTWPTWPTPVRPSARPWTWGWSTSARTARAGSTTHCRPRPSSWGCCRTRGACCMADSRPATRRTSAEGATPGRTGTSQRRSPTTTSWRGTRRRRTAGRFGQRAAGPAMTASGG